MFLFYFTYVGAFTLCLTVRFVYTVSYCSNINRMPLDPLSSCACLYYYCIPLTLELQLEDDVATTTYALYLFLSRHPPLPTIVLGKHVFVGAAAPSILPSSPTTLSMIPDADLWHRTWYHLNIILLSFSLIFIGLIKLILFCPVRNLNKSLHVAWHSKTCLSFNMTPPILTMPPKILANNTRHPWTWLPHHHHLSPTCHLGVQGVQVVAQSPPRAHAGGLPSGRPGG